MRGEVTKHTRIQPEQRLFNYLSEVATAASGRLSPAARSRFVDSLRDTIEQERSRQGLGLDTLNRILDRLGEPVTIVDAEVQRDPEYQARLSARLSVAGEGPQVPLTDDLAELLAPSSTTLQYAPQGPAALATSAVKDGPEVCLDPDPFTPDHVVETVGAIASPTVTLPELPLNNVGEPQSPVAVRVRAVWAGGPRMHPQEALAIGVFLLGAVLGNWVVLVAGGLVACTSKFYTEVEKWALTIGVPVATALVYALGFWLERKGLWGGHQASSSDLLAGAASFFGTLPRIASLLAALFLTWRLARGIVRNS